jgi:hypothetical protein
MFFMFFISRRSRLYQTLMHGKNSDARVVLAAATKLGMPTYIFETHILAKS